MYTFYRIENGRLVEADEQNAQVFFYYQLEKPEDFQPLLDKFQVTLHAVRSALDAHEVARADRTDDHTFLVCKRPHLAQPETPTKRATPFRISSVGMFLFKDKLLIVNDENIPLSDFHSTSCPIQNIQDVVLNLFHRSTLHFYEEFHILENQVRKVENSLLHSTSNSQLMKLFTHEKSMILYLNSLGKNNALFDRLLQDRELLSLTKKQITFLKVLMIDSRQCYQQAEIASEILSGLTDTTASLINNKLSLLMKRLTVISLIFLPINAIAGIGGMSEYSTVAEKFGLTLPVAYLLLCIAMCIIAYVTYLFIKRIDGD